METRRNRLDIEANSIQNNLNDLNPAPIFTDVDGNDYLLNKLAEMSYEEINSLAERVIGLHVETPLTYKLFHNFNVYLYNQLVLQRLRDHSTVLTIPPIIQRRSNLRRATTSNWSMVFNDLFFTAKYIEQMPMQDRFHIEIYREEKIVYYRGGNPQTGESWTEIRKFEYPFPILAFIDYEAPITSSFTNGHITVPIYFTPSRRYYLNGGIGLHHNNHHGSEARIPTESKWSIPGSYPITSAADIELMAELERKRLVDIVKSHGNLLKFAKKANHLTGQMLSLMIKLWQK